jgi:hypothetical protein
MLKRFLLRAAILFALLLPATPAMAWWEYGHGTVGRIAYMSVSPHTRAEIDRLLRQGRLLDTPTCSVRTIELASYWPDCIKTLGERFSYASSWHYQNVNICRPFDLRTPCADGNCVSAQIERDVALLKDRKAPKVERVKALLFLVHFVGDIGQPLHGAEHDHDAGGNKVQVSYGIFTTDRLNLHSVWDGYLAERAITSGPNIVRSYSRADRAKFGGGTVTDWGKDSWELSKTVYADLNGGEACKPINGRVSITEAMIEKWVPEARDQVIKGGLRLARLLDEALA